MANKKTTTSLVYVPTPAVEIDSAASKVAKIIRHFDNVYKEKGVHPGMDYIFFSNNPDNTNPANFVKSNYITIPTAYDKEGNLIEGSYAIFILKKSIKAQT